MDPPGNGFPLEKERPVARPGLASMRFRSQSHEGRANQAVEAGAIVDDRLRRMWRSLLRTCWLPGPAKARIRQRLVNFLQPMRHPLVGVETASSHDSAHIRRDFSIERNDIAACELESL